MSYFVSLINCFILLMHLDYRKVKAIPVSCHMITRVIVFAVIQVAYPRSTAFFERNFYVKQALVIDCFATSTTLGVAKATLQRPYRIVIFDIMISRSVLLLITKFLGVCALKFYLFAT